MFFLELFRMENGANKLESSSVRSLIIKLRTFAESRPASAITAQILRSNLSLANSSWGIITLLSTTLAALVSYKMSNSDKASERIKLR